MRLLFLAGSTDVFERVGTFAGKMGKNIQTISWTIFAAAVLICAVAWIIGGSGAQFAKSTMGRVVIGVALASLATAVISTLKSMFGGSGSASFKGGLNVMVEPLKMYLALHGINLY